MRAGSYLSVRNAAVLTTATQIFPPSAAAAALREGRALIRNIRMVTGAAQTAMVLNSFNPAGAGTATARFGIVRTAADHTFNDLNLPFPGGHGATAIASGAGVDGLLQLDGDRVENPGEVKTALVDVSLGTNSVLVAGGVNRSIRVYRVILSNAAAEAIEVGYDDDGLDANYQAITPTITNGLGDFTFYSRIPRIAALPNNSRYLVLKTAGASRAMAYVEYSDDPYPQDDGDVRTVVVQNAAGAGTVYVDVHGIAAAPPTSTVVLELLRVLGYSSAANGVVTVGYADQGAAGTGANYVPLTADLTNANRTDKLQYVLPTGKKLVMRAVYAGAATVRAHVEYRLLAS